MRFRFMVKAALAFASALFCLSLYSVGLAATTIKVSLGLPLNDPSVIAFQQSFMKYVPEKSNGTIKVDMYHTNTLGTADAVLNGVRSGVIQLAVESVSNMSQFLPVLSVLDLPYIFPTQEDVEIFAASPILGRHFAKLKGIEVEGAWMTTYRALATSKPIRKLEDAAGLKIRTTKSKMHMTTIKSLGMNPTPMAGSEVITALQQGVVDGTDSEFPSILHRHYIEVIKHICMHDAVPCLLVMFSGEKWKKNLSPQDRQIIDEGLKLFFVENKKQYTKQIKEIIAEITDKHQGKIVTLSPEEKARWIAKSSSVFADLSGDNKKLVDEIKELIKK